MAMIGNCGVECQREGDNFHVNDVIWNTMQIVRQPDFDDWAR
jgi:hypothetical protein